MIEQELRTVIEGLSSIPNTAIYPLTAPDTQKAPYMVFFKVSSPRDMDHDGFSGTTTARFQVSIFATSYQSAKLYSAELYGMVHTTSATIAWIELANERDLYESDSGLYHIALDYMVHLYEQIGD